MEYPGSLHNHDDFSNIRLKDAISTFPELIEYAIKLGHKGIAITNHDCVSDAIQILKYRDKIKEKNPDFKIVLGNEIYLCRNGLSQENYTKNDRFWHFILLAKDEEGHRQIREISSRAWKRSWKTGKMRRVPTYYQDLIDVVSPNPGHILASSACFLPGQKVRTLAGEKNIEELTSNDFIFNAKGEWEQINYPTSRYYTGPGNILTITKEPQKIKCTANHKFLIYDYENNILSWKEAKELKPQDRVVEPIAPIKYSNDTALRIKDFPEITNYRKKSIGVNYSKNIFRLSNEIILTNSLMRLFGLWLADGHISRNEESNKNNIGFTFSSKEFDIYYNSFVKQGLLDLGLTEKDYYIKKRIENNRVDLSIAKVEICLLFYSLFGLSHADSKHIPERLKHINYDLDIELFYGYLLGDGYFRYRESQGGEVVVASISYQLIKEMEQLALSFNLSGGITVSKAHTDKKGTNHQESFYLTYSNSILGKELDKMKIISHKLLLNIFQTASDSKKGRLADFVTLDGTKYRIKRIKSNETFAIDEQVYCLNTKSHNFVLDNIVVHNCLGSWLASQCLSYADNPSDSLKEEIVNWLIQMRKLFGKDNFFIELQPPAKKDNDQYKANYVLLQFAKELNIPWIITCDTHYTRKEDRPIHKAYITSQEGEREVDEFYATTYLMGDEELRSHFDFEIEECYKNIQNIFDRCENYELRKPLKIPHLPWKTFFPKSNPIEWQAYFPSIKKFIQSDYVEDREIAKTIIEKLEKEPELQEQKIYDMIEDCLDKIWVSSEVNKARWSAYLLNLQKIIDCCWEAGSIVLPSRGSGGGFILLYLLDIIQMNAAWENISLKSWRFLNPNRTSLLD